MGGGEGDGDAYKQAVVAFMVQNSVVSGGSLWKQVCLEVIGESWCCDGCQCTECTECTECTVPRGVSREAWTGKPMAVDASHGAVPCAWGGALRPLGS